jgi:hypothetical protein
MNNNKLQELGVRILEGVGQYEDKNWFAYSFIVGLFVLLGSVLGTLLDGGIDAVQQTMDSPWWACAIYTFVQLVFSLAIYYWLNKFFKGNVKSWLFTTSAGFMFSLLYFGVQNNLMINIRKTFAFLPQQQVS